MNKLLAAGFGLALLAGPAQAADTLIPVDDITCAQLEALATRDISEAAHMLGVIVEIYALENKVDFTADGFMGAVATVDEKCDEDDSKTIMGILKAVHGK